MLADAAVSRMSGIDAPVCSTGIEGPVGATTAVLPNAGRRLLAVNLEAPLWLAGLTALRVWPRAAAAIAQLACNLAVEWGPCGIRANAISPGLIRTYFAACVMASYRRVGHTRAFSSKSSVF